MKSICSFSENDLYPSGTFYLDSFCNLGNSLLDWIESSGRSVVADPIEERFIDEADKKFYEVAKFCQAKLIIGNIKHFSQDPLVVK